MVDQEIMFSYDGSFEGFLSVVFSVYERKVNVLQIVKKTPSETDIFAQNLYIETNRSNSDRVLKGLLVKSDKKIVRSLYRCFLSEKQGIEMRLLSMIREIFSGRSKTFYDYRKENVMELHKVLKMIRREVHRVHAFVRFQELKDKSYAAVIEPDFDVLPLVGSHFKNRYPAMDWLIFDTKRQYGIHYEKNEIRFVEFSESLESIKEASISEEEVEYQAMWKQYFKSVNIDERNNEKLHLRHVPKRYWKNLIEKQ